MVNANKRDCRIAQELLVDHTEYSRKSSRFQTEEARESQSEVRLVAETRSPMLETPCRWFWSNRKHTSNNMSMQHGQVSKHVYPHLET